MDGLLDVLTSPVPAGRFDSPLDHRHVLCLHLGAPVPVTWREAHAERRGTRLHGQFCVVPAGASTRWTLSSPATSLLLRLASDAVPDADIAPAIHIRDPQIERIGWMMQAERRDSWPSGRLFVDGLAIALGARLRALRGVAPSPSTNEARALPAWRLRKVIDYIEANLARDLALSELADVAEFSVSHFKTLFRNATGMPAHRFVMQRRIERARAMLAEGGQRRIDVALATGFANASHMARCLKHVAQ